MTHQTFVDRLLHQSYLQTFVYRCSVKSNSSFSCCVLHHGATVQSSQEI